MKNVFSRLALGTANFGKAYGLSGKRVTESEQKEILDFCKEVGIDMIDTATAYDWDWMKIDSYFKLVVKVKISDSVETIEQIVKCKPYCLMAHDTQIADYISSFIRGKTIKKGLSVYCNAEIKNFFEKAINVVQLPYSIFDRRMDKEIQRLEHTEIQVRSIFLQGAVFLKEIPEHLKPIEGKIRNIQGYGNPALTCLLFVLLNPCVDRVIMGVDSLKQLQDNVKFFRRLDDFEVKDENILDIREWK